MQSIKTFMNCKTVHKSHVYKNLNNNFDKSSSRSGWGTNSQYTSEYFKIIFFIFIICLLSPKKPAD